MADSEIREGFLCPICMADLGALSQLQQHFEDAHSSEDKDVLDQLKGTVVWLAIDVPFLPRFY